MVKDFDFEKFTEIQAYIAGFKLHREMLSYYGCGFTSKISEEIPNR